MSGPNRNKKSARKEPEELVLRDNDVIVGRGVGTAGFIGNVEFRFICYKVKDLYRAAHRQEKSAIAQKIMEQIAKQDPPGRFVELIEGTTLEDRRCILAPFEQAVEKTCQALREKKNGCPRQYRQFDSKKKPSARTSKGTSPPIMPRISDKELSLIKKNIEEVTGKSDTPDRPNKKPQLDAEPKEFRKTSRQIMMDHNISKRQEEVKRASRKEEKARNTPKKQLAPASPEKAAKRASIDMSAKRGRPLSETPVKKFTVSGEKVAKKSPPPVSDKPVKRRLPVADNEKTTKKAKMTDSWPVIPQVLSPPKLKVAQPKVAEQPTAPIMADSDEETLPENSFQARIFLPNRSVRQNRSRKSAACAFKSRIDRSQAATCAAGASTQGGARPNDNADDNDECCDADDQSDELGSMQEQDNVSAPKYPYVPYPFCFLQSLSALDIIPDPANLTAEDILASFSLANAAAAKAVVDE